MYSVWLYFTNGSNIVIYDRVWLEKKSYIESDAFDEGFYYYKFVLWLPSK